MNSRPGAAGPTRDKEVHLLLDFVPVTSPVRMPYRHPPATAETLVRDGEVLETKRLAHEADLEVVWIHTDLRRHIWHIGTTWTEAGPKPASVPSASATGRRLSPTVRLPRPRRWSAGSTSSSAAAWRRPSRTRPDTPPPKRDDRGPAALGQLTTDARLGKAPSGGGIGAMETFNVGSKIGGSRLGMSVYDLPPGEAIGPGRVTIRTPTGERVLDPGEVVCFPAGPRRRPPDTERRRRAGARRDLLHEERVWHRRVPRKPESGNPGGRHALHARPPGHVARQPTQTKQRWRACS